jgi:hypothetical protein
MLGSSSIGSIALAAYFVNEEGYLMPTRKDQPAPDLKFFSASRK